jgi:hypothetical protein
VSGNATYDAQTPAALQEYSARNSLYQSLRSGGTTSDFGAKGNQVPDNLRQLAASYGMLNKDGSLNPNWSQPLPVAPRYSAYGALLPASTNTYYDPSLLGQPTGSPGGK